MVYDVIVYVDYDGKSKVAVVPCKKKNPPNETPDTPKAYNPFTGEYE